MSPVPCAHAVCPAGHTVWQAPSTQRSAPLHATPQAPQFAESVITDTHCPPHRRCVAPQEGAASSAPSRAPSSGSPMSIPESAPPTTGVVVSQPALISVAAASSVVATSRSFHRLVKCMSPPLRAPKWIGTQLRNYCGR